MNSDKNLVLDFNEICRLCLSKEGVMLPIFDDGSKEDDLPISSRIVMCASIEVSQGDGLPSLVCDRCVNHLDRWYTFKEQCCSSDATLRQYVTSHAKILLVDTEDMKIKQDDESKFTRFLHKTLGDRRNITSTKGTQTILSKTVTVTTKRNIRSYAGIKRRAMLRNKKPVRKNVSRGNPVNSVEFMDALDLKPDLSTLSLTSSHSEVSSDDEMLPPESISFEASSRKQFGCAHCPKIFLSRYSLLTHEMTHTGEKRFFCEQCGKGFYTEQQLKSHVSTHSEEKPHICDTCGKAFRTKHLLNLHTKTHSSVTPYLCNICGKSFKTKGTMECHFNVHSQQKNYVCAECGKGFKWKHSFTMHAKVHSPCRPLSCEFCGKGFKRKKDLERHLLIHTNEKPYTCTFCERKFSAKWNLTQHLRLHTGARPYVCGVCGEAFTHNVTLRKHAKLHAQLLT